MLKKKEQYKGGDVIELVNCIVHEFRVYFPYLEKKHLPGRSLALINNSTWLINLFKEDLSLIVVFRVSGG